MMRHHRQRLVTLMGLTSLVASMIALLSHFQTPAPSLNMMIKRPNRTPNNLYLHNSIIRDKGGGGGGTGDARTGDGNGNQIQTSDTQLQLQLLKSILTNSGNNLEDINIIKPEASGDSSDPIKLNGNNFYSSAASLSNALSGSSSTLLRPINSLNNNQTPSSGSSSTGSESSASQAEAISAANSVPTLGVSGPSPIPAPSVLSSSTPRKGPPTTTRKPVFDESDLELTRRLLIDKPNYCDTDRGAAYDLLIMVTSAVGHFDARQAIRDTWGAFAVERGSLVLFLVGSPPTSDNSDGSLQDRIYQEDSEHGDILQATFLDSYYNLTLKSLTMLHWVATNCDQVKYVLKIDDDMFVNMQLLVDFTETRLYPRSIIGKLAKGWKPHRDVGNKWYMPSTAFAGKVFPTFATGPAYLFTGDASRPLYNATHRIPAVYLEDVYMTGLLAEAAKIRRLNHALMRNVRLRVTRCTFGKFITSHMHTPDEIRRLWKTVYDTNDEAVNPCPTPPPPPTRKATQKAVGKGNGNNKLPVAAGKKYSNKQVKKS